MSMTDTRRDSGPSHAVDPVMLAIEALYAQRFVKFHRVASAIVGDAEQGRDAVQEAFARAISRRADYRGDGPLEGWLWRTVINVAKDHRRTARGTTLIAEPEELADRPQADPFEGVVREHVAALPERQRLALFLRYYVDMSYSQIGDALQIQTGTVSATLNAAHRSLRTALSGGSAPARRTLDRPARRGAAVARTARAA